MGCDCNKNLNQVAWALGLEGRWTLKGPWETVRRSLADLEEAVVRIGSEMRVTVLETEGKGRLVL